MGVSPAIAGATAALSGELMRLSAVLNLELRGRNLSELTPHPIPGRSALSRVGFNPASLPGLSAPRPWRITGRGKHRGATRRSQLSGFRLDRQESTPTATGLQRPRGRPARRVPPWCSFKPIYDGSLCLRMGAMAANGYSTRHSLLRAAESLRRSDRVVAHETAHLFGAADEYNCSAISTHRIDATTNANCFPFNPLAVPCLMRGNFDAMCLWIRAHIAWS